jgi:spermidine/putrescine transport system substrate-binding protein
MNYILSPKVHATITNFTSYGNPNDSAKAYIKKSIMDDKNIFLDKVIMDNSKYIQDVGSTQALYDKIWSTIKAH